LTRGRKPHAAVSVVIVSHSTKVAEGAADMVRQMVGDRSPSPAAMPMAAWERRGGHPGGD
jgi:hypothetical protein